MEARCPGGRAQRGLPGTAPGAGGDRARAAEAPCALARRAGQPDPGLRQRAAGREPEL